MNVLPLVQRFYLFAGLGGTLGTRVTQSGPKAGVSAGLRLYHCHYDLQPNLPCCLALVAGFGRSNWLRDLGSGWIWLPDPRFCGLGMSRGMSS